MPNHGDHMLRPSAKNGEAQEVIPVCPRPASPRATALPAHRPPAPVATGHLEPCTLLCARDDPGPTHHPLPQGDGRAGPNLRLTSCFLGTTCVSACPQRENEVGTWGGWRPSGWELGLILGKADRELGKGSQEISNPVGSCQTQVMAEPCAPEEPA